jgi:hypothetical protein
VNADGGTQIENFDAFSGSGCGQGPVRVLASSVVVNTQTCLPSQFTSIQILDPPRNGYGSGTIDFVDSNNQPISGVPTQTVDNTGSVDLSAFNLLTGTGLPQFLITLNNPVNPVGQVQVKITWQGTYDPSCVQNGTTVTGQLPTSITTSLSGGGHTGTSISVPGGTAVTDSATLSGTNAATATGTVTYTVFDDSNCTHAVNTGTALSITTPGQLPNSAAVTLNTAGTYYWQAAYSGDTNNASSTSTCGAETETVSQTTAPTTVTTSLSDGTHTGANLSVPPNTGVTDQATVHGTNAASAGGTVTYTVYSDGQCAHSVASGGTKPVTNGTGGVSNAVSLANAGTYYWQASYSGDGNNASSVSRCGDEVETVTQPARFAGAFVIGDKSAGAPTVGKSINFWGAQWAKKNSLSGGSAPAAFKGFADTPTSPSCGTNWKTRPGNSSNPPSTLPSQIIVIVSSKVTKSGSSIGGDTVHLVLVNVGPGYGPNPGHAGNGTIASVIC